MYKVLIAGLDEELVKALAESVSYCSFKRYEELPENPDERVKLYRSFDAVFYLGKRERLGKLPDSVKDLYDFQTVVEDGPAKEYDDPDYYDFFGDTASQTAEHNRTIAFRRILDVLRPYERG